MSTKMSTDRAINGGKHLTKNEIQEKKDKEVKSVLLTEVPSCPTYLTTKEQKKTFRKLAKQLIEAKIFTELDIDTLGRFCIAQSQYEFLTKKSNENFELLLDKNFMSQYSKIQDQLLKLSRELGLTVNSRSKFNVVEVEVKKPNNKFDELFK